jgi:two-component system cell cycle sensor histidine kinase/response regulator CckA
MPVAHFAPNAEDLYIGLESFTNTPPFVALAVADQGSGIAPHVLPRIFESYFTTKEPGKGTGLGLAIVARLVKAGHGYIHVNTRISEGTTMTIVLPAQLTATAAPAARPAANAPLPSL